MNLFNNLIGCGFILIIFLAVLPNTAAAYIFDGIKLAKQLEMNRYPPSSRIEIVANELDARLLNGQCESPKLSFPKGSKPWGTTLVKVHCDHQTTSFYQSVDVRVWAITALAQHTINFQEIFSAEQLKTAEMDLSKLPPLGWSGNPDELVGKQSTRQIAPGTIIRADMFKAKAAIQSGDTVRISMKGAGFHVGSDGVALTSANLGQTIRVRTPQGKVLTGQAKSDLIVEVTL